MSAGHLTRLAPSPTGALHLGNARTFLVNWLLARQNGWRIVLRIEDLDGPRIKRGADVQLMEDLRWLGLGWDDGPFYQSGRMDLYKGAIEQLLSKKLAYPCVCSRREVESAPSAPHAEDGSGVYPGTCRDRFDSLGSAQRECGRAPAARFRVDMPSIEFQDRFAGPQRFEPGRQLGDFVIAKADGTPAYQLAVVVDDAAMGVNCIVRGDDLLDSTPRQIMLYRALGLDAAIPSYWHLPLVVGTDGRRLAKRHGDTRLASYRAHGVPAGRVISLLARWSGIEGPPEQLRPEDLIESFRLEKISKSPIIFGPWDDAFLLSANR